MDTKVRMNELAEGCDILIASPQGISHLENQGIHFERVAAPTIKERFDERLQNAAHVALQLPELPPIELPPHAIQSLYEEILDCILFGVNGAATTLSGNLIEFTLKHAAFVVECGGYQNYDPVRWDSFEQIDFANAIGRAKAAGLLG